VSCQRRALVPFEKRENNRTGPDLNIAFLLLLLLMLLLPPTDPRLLPLLQQPAAAV
jgi:hypothetical protein